jgi:hypothetical protein
MQLITMAHLGEAQGVIDYYQLQRLNSQLYENQELTCLITGEGPFEAAIKTSAQLARGSYKRVLNVGIAGALESSLLVGEFYPIRGLYLVNQGRPEFKSFKAQDQGLDCLTSFERILSPQRARILQGLGHVVEREAWGVAMAAKEAQVPFSCFKLISDQAGTLGACELTRAQAQEWAQLILKGVKSQLTLSLPSPAPLELEGFYFTHSTSLKLKESLKKLSLREGISTEEILQKLPLSQWREQKILPKERTRLLLEFLDHRLDPLKERLERALYEWKRPFEKNKIQLHTDPTWESKVVRVQFEVSDDQELSSILKKLEQLELDGYQRLQRGELDVE